MAGFCSDHTNNSCLGNCWELQSDWHRSRAVMCGKSTASWKHSFACVFWVNFIVSLNRRNVLPAEKYLCYAEGSQVLLIYQLRALNHRLRVDLWPKHVFFPSKLLPFGTFHSSDSLEKSWDSWSSAMQQSLEYGDPSRSTKWCRNQNWSIAGMPQGHPCLS